MIDRERMVQEFLELVAIPSLSRRERAFAAAVKERLVALGLEVEEDEAGTAIGGDANNIVAHLPATAPGLPCLMLNAHLDTVTPGENIRAMVDGDRIVSDGTTIVGADCKCGIAVILEALRALREQALAHGGVEVVLTVAEEIGLMGAKHLDWSKTRAKMGYVLDGGETPAKITVAAPYANKINFAVRGRAAHAGVCPEKGLNAIQVAARGLAAMRLGRIDDETTANIGVIRGGQAPNIVPDRCELLGEARSHNEEKLRAQTDHMVKAMQAAARQAGAEVEIDLRRDYNGFRLGPEDPVVALATEALRDLGLEPTLHVGGGGSDANIFNEHGLPSVILSTGAGAVHTTNEYAYIPTMVHSAEWLVAIFRRLETFFG
ncbi:MAG: M20/M25/M40 family metallo-hydrolase [Armatimonadetes bacterium]|nr:M20/M25/M40 family metallo-hydrolase [Armatimonadota bacterium]